MSFRLTRGVKALLVVCVGAFLVQQTADQFFGTHLLSWFALVPAGFALHHRLWQLVTYSFLHGDVMHLFLNLLMLVFIGVELESAWGTARFLRYYFFCSVSAGIVYLLLQLFVGKGMGLYVPMLGASGAIYGLLVAYGLIFGERVLLFMLLFPMKAKHFIWILAAVEFFSSIYSGRSGLASFAHLGGMAAGFAYLWVNATFLLMKKRRKDLVLERGKKVSKKRPPAKHLKLIVNNKEAVRDFDSKGENDQDNPPTWH